MIYRRRYRRRRPPAAHRGRLAVLFTLGLIASFALPFVGGCLLLAFTALYVRRRLLRHNPHLRRPPFW